jgi:predicted nucleic acid-binding protein
MSGTDKLIYWDACVYLAWLKEEKEHGQQAIDAILQTAKDNFEKKVIIVTSTITYVEVLSSHMNEDQERSFRRSFRTQHHIARDVDPPVALKAREFREKLLSHKSGKTLATPDAIHLATASIYRAEFWTFDEGNKGHHLGLIELNGEDRIDRLTICKPYLNQGVLPLTSN